MSQLRLALLGVLFLVGPTRAGLDLQLRGGALGGSVGIDLTGDAGETYLIFVSDDPNNIIKWSSITLSTPGFIGGLDAAGEASAVLPLPGSKILDGLQLYFQAFTVQGPPFVLDDTSPLCRMALAEKHGVVASGSSLNTARTNAAAVVLADGRVLITGGGGGTIFSPVPVSSADIYDLCTDTFSASAGTMSTERAFHTATRLQDGRVLVVGGVDVALTVTGTADLYDPATDQFIPTGSLAFPRIGHTATLLDDGRVLITGGTRQLLPDYLAFLFNNTAWTEIYDPVTGTFTRGPNIDSGSKAFHTATRLQDGKVLLSGGYTIVDVFGSAVAEITARASLYDPLTNGFLFDFERRMWTPRAGHSASLLPDGRVLLAGGGTQPVETSPTTSLSELYDPGFDNYRITSGRMSERRGMMSLFTLNDGRAVALGGVTGDFLAVSATSLIEIFDPGTELWTPVSDTLSVPRAAAVGIPLASGRFLIMGGSDASESPQLSADLFVQ